MSPEATQHVAAWVRPGTARLVRAIPCIVFFIGVLLVIAAEIAAFVVVAEQIGFFWALLILVVVSALGPFIVRRVGFGVLVHTRERLNRGEVPGRELLDGLVVLMGGVMICVPGFIGDAIGLLLMVGPIRHLVIRASGNQLAGRIGRIRAGTWTVIDARARPTRDEGPPSWRPPGPPLGPDDRFGG